MTLSRNPGNPLRRDPAKPLKSTARLPGSQGPERRVPLRQVSATRSTPRNSGPSPAVRRLVLGRDGYACACCGLSIIGRRYSLAHRVRASQGGKPVAENLVTLLGWGGELHHGRVDLYRDPADAVKGYRLPSNGKPAEVPVAYVTPDGLEWFLLLPDGTRERTAEPEGWAAA